MKKIYLYLAAGLIILIFYAWSVFLGYSFGKTQEKAKQAKVMVVALIKNKKEVEEFYKKKLNALPKTIETMTVYEKTLVNKTSCYSEKDRLEYNKMIRKIKLLRK